MPAFVQATPVFSKPGDTDFFSGPFPAPLTVGNVVLVVTSERATVGATITSITDDQDAVLYTLIASGLNALVNPNVPARVRCWRKPVTVAQAADTIRVQATGQLISGVALEYSDLSLSGAPVDVFKGNHSTTPVTTGDSGTTTQTIQPVELALAAATALPAAYPVVFTPDAGWTNRASVGGDATHASLDVEEKILGAVGPQTLGWGFDSASAYSGCIVVLKPFDTIHRLFKPGYA